MKTSVIIPTLEAENNLPLLLSKLVTQSKPPHEIIIIDSSSTDRTIEIAKQHHCNIHTLNRQEFKHGKARNLGAQLAEGDILVFLTQDVLPVNNYFLEELCYQILNGNAQAVTARQIPYPDAHPTEVLARHFNYPPQSHIRTMAMLPEMGIRTFFFSNSASAIDHEIFDKLGGFAEDVIVNEDMDFCTRLLERGFNVAYQAESQVYHSHNYSLRSLFKRYFDIGIFFSQAPPALDQAPTSPDGTRLIATSTKSLVAQKKWLWVLRLYGEVVTKFSAFHLGLRHHLLPPWIKPMFSGQTYYWESTRP